MYSRHDLVWLTPQAWEAALAELPLDARAPLDQWPRADWPAVVRRPDAGMPLDEVAIGLALPPDPVTGIKARVALRALTEGITRHEGALPLARAAAAAPDAWRDRLHALATGAPACGLRAYGSLALQAITSLPYLTPGSDIDLLLAPANRAQLEEGIALLTKYAAQLPLDGEIVFPDGAAVAWKEWSDAGAQVLVKSMGPVRLAAREELIAALERA
jgi:phosphoribosyl-dephospho-CoA transferase